MNTKITGKRIAAKMGNEVSLKYDFFPKEEPCEGDFLVSRTGKAWLLLEAPEEVEFIRRAKGEGSTHFILKTTLPKKAFHFVCVLFQR